MGVRTYSKIARVYLDMDGVLADFEASAAHNQSTPSSFNRVAGAYRSLAPTAGAVAAVRSLETAGLLVFALTKIPRLNPYAATEKILWLSEHFPSLEDRVIITPDKGCVGTTEDFLVDDHPEWANAHSFSGSVIHFVGRSDVAWTDTVLQILTISQSRARELPTQNLRGAQ